MNVASTNRPSCCPVRPILANLPHWLHQRLSACAASAVSKLHDDRVIHLLQTLLYPGGSFGDWTSCEVHTRFVARYRLAGDEHGLSQLRYELPTKPNLRTLPH
jgi:hypothetical protein